MREKVYIAIGFFIAGIISCAIIGYFACVAPLASAHAQDELRAIKAEQLAEQYHADALAAQGNLKSTRNALDRANSRIGDIIGRAGSAQGTPPRSG